MSTEHGVNISNLIMSYEGKLARQERIGGWTNVRLLMS